MADVVAEPRPVPVGAVDRTGVGWWGVMFVILTEGALFAYLLFAYYYYVAALDPAWMPGTPSLGLAIPITVVVIASSLAAWWGERGVRLGNQGQLLAGIATAWVLGVLFIVLELIELNSKSFTPENSLYGSVFYTIYGLHFVHMAVGVLALLLLLFWSLLGYFSPTRSAPVSIVNAYWYFASAVWVVFFVAVYLTPYLGWQ